MTSIALPIMELGYGIKRKAVVVQREAEEIIQPKLGLMDHIRAGINVIRIAVGFQRILVQERELIAILRRDSIQGLECEQLEKMAAQLDEVVARINAMTDGAERLTRFENYWRDSIADVRVETCTIESIAESLHMAADPYCEAVFAIASEAVAA